MEFVHPAIVGSVIARVRPGDEGAASGVLTATQIANALGIAIVTAAWSATASLAASLEIAAVLVLGVAGVAQLVPGAGTCDVIDPATGEVIATAPTADDDQVHRAVSAAETALRTWRATPWTDRATALHRIADAVAPLLALGTGKPLAMADGLEVQWGVR
ncbi:hypothetical protein CTZ28_17270 [Streptomyces shenzhenensis]|uniref:Aldehyde dehydrogenase domain-containing protein n=2 Tax=Streptomyces shenzhenensis TaxID=943815 RepID=A0A3M0IF62_9ACTN|nr:hypothetical protein CTZ28_17270 [Streptomyces shenzhenensis]